MTSAVDERIVLARAYLNRICEPGTMALWAFVAEAGPVEAALAVRNGTAPASVLSCTAARRADADPAADLDAAEAHGARLVVPESAEWPYFGLAALANAAEQPRPRSGSASTARTDTSRRDSLVPPIALWVRGSGDLASLGMRSVSIVGSRAATSYGEHVTAEFAYGLAARDVTVVSGGAFGIDAVAHRSAMASGGRTVIVSAGGIDRPYPPSNAALFERAVDGGLVISEYPPGCAPHRSRFLIRNRLIASFCAGVVVVEAAMRSGARNTAGYATDLGRPLMVVPGPITSAMSAGCHDLLRSDLHSTVVVTSVDDVLAIVGAAGEGLPSDVVLARPAGDLRDDLDLLDPTSRRIFDGLMLRRYLLPEEIAKRTGVDVLSVIRSLPGLQLADLIENESGGFRVAERARRTTAPH